MKFSNWREREGGREGGRVPDLESNRTCYD